MKRVRFEWFYTIRAWKTPEYQRGRSWTEKDTSDSLKCETGFQVHRAFARLGSLTDLNLQHNK